MNEHLIAYCGSAPAPADLLAAWNLDPPLLVALALAGAWAWRRGAAGGAAGRGAWILLALAFVSPLCALSSALFSARVAHHLVLIAGAAPLLALALPQRRAGGLALAAALHAVALWAWHAPPLYAWGLASAGGYWLMQATLLGSAVLLWRAVLARDADPAAAVATLVASVAQMGLLGALLVFAPAPLYGAHLASTWAWGLSPLADQQLAGLVMWVLSAGPYMGAGLWMVWRTLTPPPRGAEA